MSGSFSLSVLGGSSRECYVNRICGCLLGEKSYKIMNTKTHRLVPGYCQASEVSLQISVLVFWPFAVTECADETTGRS